MRRLIVNADDYGISPGVSRGILRAGRGLVSSTTVMANLVTPEAIGELVESCLPAGIHLNLTAGPALTPGYPAELLTTDGTFDKQTALCESTWSNHEFSEAAVREWDSQITMLADLGLQPTHLDSHHHVHLVPRLFEAALELSVQLGIGLRTRLRQLPLANARNVKSPDLLIEGFFGADMISKTRLLALLDACDEHTDVELICHPGIPDPDLRLISGYTDERQLELEVLEDESLIREIGQSGWVLCGYNEL